MRTDHATVGRAISVESHGALDDLPPGYRALFDDAGRTQAFLSFWWFKNLVDTTLEDGARPRIYGVEDGSAIPLALLVARSPAGQNGSILADRAIGSRTLASMTNYQSAVFGPLLSSDVKDPAPVMRELARGVSSERPAWDLVDLDFLDPEERWFTPLADGFRAAGLVVRPYFKAGSRYDRFDGRGYEAYLRSRPPAVRKEFQNYLRKRRRLERLGSVRTRIFTSAGEVDEGIAHYDLVHRASWKQPERFGRFPEGLMRAAAEAGALRLGVLYVDGRPVATEVGIVAGGRASMVKTAYDEQYAPHSVGALVMMDVMRHVVDVDGALEVDFGVDDAPYKRLWLSRRRERWGLVSFNPRSAGGVRSLTRHLLGQAATCLARSVRPAVAAATRRLARVTVRSGRP